MKIAVLTSSRADYGIYRPLLKAFASEGIDFSIIAFGTHLSKKHGFTINEIENDGFQVAYSLETIGQGDSPLAIVKSIASTTDLFADFWGKNEHRFDLIFCFGDRYEMFAAVQAGVPFNLHFAHIHGGEQTLGAIDNIFRHCISIIANIHFASHETYAKRIQSITGDTEYIYTVGALGLDNVQEMELLSKKEIKKDYGIDLNKPTILFTFHPETVHPESNKKHIENIISVLEKHSNYKIVITGTNTDTASTIIRESLQQFVENNDERAFFFESLGTQGYYSFMCHCSFIMGNSSSGIIEAASFGKYVIDLGDRQKGRIAGKNVLSIAINEQEMNKAIDFIENAEPIDFKNIYWKGGAAKQIIKIIKQEFNG